MANEPKQDNRQQQPIMADINEIALQIYSQRVASRPAKRGLKVLAEEAFRSAEAFLVVQGQVQRGELKPKEAAVTGPQLTDCCAPNRHRTDPHNLVSSRFGSLEKVAAVKKWLDHNPTPEGDPMDIVERFRAAFSDLHWGTRDDEVFASIGVARLIFPAYCAK